VNITVRKNAIIMNAVVDAKMAPNPFPLSYCPHPEMAQVTVGPISADR
jgi:hypothetical protein